MGMAAIWSASLRWTRLQTSLSFSKELAIFKLSFYWRVFNCYKHLIKMVWTLAGQTSICPFPPDWVFMLWGGEY